MQYLYGAFQGQGKNFFIVLRNYMQVFKTECYCLMPSFREVFGWCGLGKL